MGKHRIFLNELLPQGKELLLDDPSIWDAPLVEFGVECRITEPLRVALTLLPMQGGCLVRGILTGAVIQPCDLCAEDAPASIHHTIETFAAIPGLADDGDEDEGQGMDTDMSDHVQMEKGIPVLDLDSLCWEEFMLALPLRPLCSSQCKGLCPQCGANRNTTACECAEETGDPRLAALRQYKVNTPEKNSGK